MRGWENIKRARSGERVQQMQVLSKLHRENQKSTISWFLGLLEKSLAPRLLPAWTLVIPFCPKNDLWIPSCPKKWCLVIPGQLKNTKRNIKLQNKYARPGEQGGCRAKPRQGPTRSPNCRPQGPAAHGLVPSAPCHWRGPQPPCCYKPAPFLCICVAYIAQSSVSRLAMPPELFC